MAPMLSISMAEMDERYTGLTVTSFLRGLWVFIV